jgi:prepilin-type N-terminal cleavage/methylation domain-containing protein
MLEWRVRKSGFTLIELMIVTAILGILVGISMLRYADLLRRANEGAAYGNLGVIRSALSIYYSDMEGQFPATLGALTAHAKFLKAIPELRVPNYHNSTSAFSLGDSAGDSGGWLYNNVIASAKFGVVLVDCTHTDTKGSVWSAY